jgi:IS30 family transposase
VVIDLTNIKLNCQDTPAQHKFNTALQKALQSDTKQIRTTIARNLKERWEAKRLLGQFPQSLDEGLIDKEQSYQWLKLGDIKGETKCHNGSSGRGN